MTLLPNLVFYFDKSLLTLELQLSLMLTLFSIFEISTLLKLSSLFQLAVGLSHDVFLAIFGFCLSFLCYFGRQPEDSQNCFQVKLYGFGRSRVIAGILKKSSFSGSCRYRS
jgi:hypothetical protein